MRYTRRARATMSPSPAPNGRASTPMKDPVTGQLMPEVGALSRTPVPAKYSTSYGSPMTQLPDRATAAAGLDITKAAAQIFTAVKRDNVAAEARRRAKDRARRVKAGETPSPPSPVQPTIEVDEPEPEGHYPSGDESDEYEHLSEDEDHPRSRTTKRSPRKPQQKTAQKRRRDDEEAEARAEQERKERDERLKRERSLEAHNLRKQKQAEEKAAREKAAREKAEKAARERAEKAAKAASEKAEKERIAQANREAAARAAMPPPPQPPTPVPDITVTPSSATPTLLDGLSVDRPGSARSFVEEGNIFREAAVKTPVQEQPKPPRRAGPPPPTIPPEPAQPAAPKPGPAAPPAEPASPPSVLKRPPRRPGGTTPASRSTLSSVPIQQRATTQQRLAESEASASEDEDQSQQSSPSDQQAASSFASRVRSRLKPLPGPMGAAEEEPESAPSSAAYESDSAAYEHRAPWTKPKHAFTPWSIFKNLVTIVAGAFVMLHLLRLGHILARPDLFDNPSLTLRWYGWDDWTSNVGQFFPSPLLHPLGVLTDKQYDDLKDYLQRRATATEKAVNDLKWIMPKVVSVRKDKTGRILVADEFWNALKDRIQHDSSLLSLDGKSRISDKHWKAVEQRLKDTGLLTKPLSTSDVERIVDKSAPASFEKWLEKNKRKVADTIGQGKGPSKGTGETVVSKDEFLREVNRRLAESKKEVDSEMDRLRKELHDLINDVKKIAAASGMTKADTTALVKQVVDQEVTRRLARVGGGKSGGVGVDAIFRSRVNHFATGNNAQVDTSLTSPSYKIVPPLLGSKEWNKAMRTRPQFALEASQALAPWSEPGHCWCAGILGDNNRTNPAQLAVQLPQFIIPQHVVLEHIDPASTTDPLAMPRDIELWAMFDEHGRKQRVLDWMAAQYPADHKDGNNKKLMDKGWAKIGAFTYEHRPQDEGVYVHQLSRDLVDLLKAATDFVIVRAVTNYGAKDHTCFYRVRLYGDVVEDLQAEKESRKW